MANSSFLSLINDGSVQAASTSSTSDLAAVAKDIYSPNWEITFYTGNGATPAGNFSEPVNAFGTPAVIVALSVRTKEPEYFAGFCVVADEPAVAAAMSVLSATNRFIQRIQGPI